MVKLIDILKNYKATGLILLINTIMFALIIINGGPNTQTLIRFGAANSDLIAKGEYYRLFTHAFVHLSYIHFIFNMIVIYMMAPSIEDKFGPWVVISTYLLVALFEQLFSPLVFKRVSAGGGSSVGYFGLYGLAIGTLFFYKDEKINGWARQYIIPMVLIILGSEAYFRIIHGSDSFLLEYNIGHILSLLGGMILSGVFSPRGYELKLSNKIAFATVFVSFLFLFFYLGYYSY